MCLACSYFTVLMISRDNFVGLPCITKAVIQCTKQLQMYVIVQ